MDRRHAILDDNDRKLRNRLAELTASLPRLIQSRVCAAMVIGSVAEGRARDVSDIDLLLVLREGGPRRGDYAWWDVEIESLVNPDGRRDFPVSPLFVAREAVRTTEPNLRQALGSGIPLWDPEGVFDDQPASRA